MARLPIPVVGFNNGALLNQGCLGIAKGQNNSPWAGVQLHRQDTPSLKCFPTDAAVRAGEIAKTIDADDVPREYWQRR